MAGGGRTDYISSNPAYIYLLYFIGSDKRLTMGCLTFYFNQILPTVNSVSLWSRSLAGSHKASFCVCFRNAARNVQTCLPVTSLSDKPCECSLYLLGFFSAAGPQWVWPCFVLLRRWKIEIPIRERRSVPFFSLIYSSAINKQPSGFHCGIFLTFCFWMEIHKEFQWGSLQRWNLKREGKKTQPGR